MSAKDADEPPADGPEVAYQLASVRLSRADQRGLYVGVSNAVLWPLLHSFPPTIRLGEAPWSNYVAGNQAFAATTLQASGPTDLIWIQDYHLMLVPGLVRKERPTQRIGWFCHVPWPSPDLFSIMPWRSAILNGLLGADVLGFHTDEYSHNFLECVARLTDYFVDYDRRTVRMGTREVSVITAPIGISLEDARALASRHDVAEEASRIKSLVGGRRIVLGVDRLDYTKGIPERILAFEEYLKADRAARNRVVFVQVMVPSRTAVEAYARLKEEIDRLVGDINGRFSSTGRVAIHYLYRNLEPAQLYAHYRAADVALVTPLRDGMNLVAMEYVASRVHEDGTLILSEFAGAAQYLEDAVQVNPYDITGIADALRDSLAAPPEETRARMRRMREEVSRLDVHGWADGYLRHLEGEG